MGQPQYAFDEQARKTYRLDGDKWNEIPTAYDDSSKTYYHLIDNNWVTTDKLKAQPPAQDSVSGQPDPQRPGYTVYPGGISVNPEKNQAWLPKHGAFVGLGNGSIYPGQGFEPKDQDELATAVALGRQIGATGTAQPMATKPSWKPSQEAIASQQAKAQAAQLGPKVGGAYSATYGGPKVTPGEGSAIAEAVNGPEPMATMFEPAAELMSAGEKVLSKTSKIMGMKELSKTLGQSARDIDSAISGKEEETHGFIDNASRFMLKMPVTLLRMRLTGPAGEAAIAGINKYQEALDHGATEGEALAAAGISAGGTYLLFKIPGSDKVASLPKAIANRLFRASLLTAGGVATGALSTMPYDTQAAKEQLTSPEAWKTNAAHMLGWEGLGLMTHDIPAINAAKAGGAQAPATELETLLAKKKLTPEDQARIVQLHEEANVPKAAPEAAPEEAPKAFKESTEKPTDLSQRQIAPGDLELARTYADEKAAEQAKTGLPKTPEYAQTPEEAKASEEQQASFERGEQARKKFDKQAPSYQEMLDNSKRFEEVDNRLAQIEKKALERSGGNENRAYRRFLDRNEEYQSLVKEAESLHEARTTLEETAPKHENEAQPERYKGLQYLNAGLDLTAKLKEHLGLPADAPSGDVIKAAWDKIGGYEGLGKTARETAIKILEKFKGIGRDVANKLAEFFHQNAEAPELSERGKALKEQLTKYATENPTEFRRQLETRPEKLQAATELSDKADKAIRTMEARRIDMARTDQPVFADKLGLGAEYSEAMDRVKSKLGLDVDATEGQVAQEVYSRIKGIGNSVRETAIKILNKFPEMGRKLANALAQHFHDFVSGANKGQRGAMGKDVTEEAIARAKAEQAARREEIKNSDMSKEERAAAYKAVEPLESLASKHGAPQSPEEASKLLAVSSDTSVPVKERNAALAKLGEAAKNGIVPDVSHAIAKPTPKSVSDFLANLDAQVLGDGVVNPETGAQKILPVAFDSDPHKAAESVRRELQPLERLQGKIGSASHAATGSLSLSVEDGTIGAFAPDNNFSTDMLVAQSTAMPNAWRAVEALGRTFDEAGIKNTSSVSKKAMAPAVDAWVEAMTAFKRAEYDVKQADTPTTQARLDAARKALETAVKTVEIFQRKVALSPEHGDYRVLLAADKMRPGSSVPEWLDAAMSDGEKKAAKALSDQLAEVKEAADRAGVPTREDYGVPHLLTDIVSKKQLKSLKDWSGVRNELQFNPESVAFQKRADNSILLSTDLHGTVMDYLPRAADLISRREVANKWSTASALLGPEKAHAADLIRSAMKDYTEGAGGKLQWMDDMNRVFSGVLVGFRTATAVKHIPKFAFELANTNLIDAAKGWAEYRKAAQANPELSRIMDDLTKAAKGPRYSTVPDLGAGEGVGIRAKTLAQKAENASHYPLQWVEGALRGTTFKMNVLAGFKAGLSPEAAFSDALYRSLLVNFQPSDAPKVMRTSVGRSAFFLQQTVWKIMEQNMRVGFDLARGAKRGAETAISGEKLGAEEKQRYQQAIKHAAAMSAIYALSKKYDVKLFDWVSEAPTMLKAMALPAIKWTMAKVGLGDEKHVPSATDIVRESPTAFPAVQEIYSAADKYGLGSKGFFQALLTPRAVQDIAFKPTKFQMKKSGPGLTGLAKRVTGLTDAEKEEQMVQQLERAKHRKQEKASEKEMRRWYNPLSELGKNPESEEK